MNNGAAGIPAELATLLRQGRALAVHATDGSGIFPDGAASTSGFVPDAALSRQLIALAATLPSNGASALADLPLEGLDAPTIPCGCRLLTTEDGQRALVIIPIIPWSAAGTAVATASQTDDPLHAVKAAMQAHLDAPQPSGALLSAPERDPAPPAPSQATDNVTPQAAPSADDGTPVRVLWQSDADGVITQAGSRLRQLLGPQSGAIAGKRWHDLIDDLLIDPEGALADALAARTTASKIPLLWSVDDAPGPVVVDWSALPVFGKQGDFRGFRGFLLVHAQDQAQSHGSDHERGTAAAAQAAKPADEQSTSAPTVTPAPQPAQTPALSESERMAFRELARALGAKFAPDLKTPEPKTPEPKTLEPKTPETKTPEPKTEEPSPPPSVAAIAAPVHDRAPAAPLPVEPQQQQDMHPAPELPGMPGESEVKPEQPVSALASPAPVSEAPPFSTTTEPPVSAVDPVVAPVTVPMPVTHIVRVPDPRYLDVIERLPMGVLINRAEHVLFANRTLLDLLDYHSLAAINDAGGTHALFKGRIPISERDGPSGPVLLCARDGERVSVDARLQNIHWDGAPATLVSFRRSADIELGQKLRAAESELKAREAQLRETRAILDTTTDGVAVLDEQGRILSINRTAEALFGYEQKEMAGESITELIAPESRTSVLDYFEGLKSGGVRSVLNDGREITARVRQGGRIPVFLSFGQITEKPEPKFCAVIRDLTAWKKSERELVDARKAAEKASEQKTDFLAKISHEVRTPLNAIIGFAEVMMEERFGPVGNERYKDYLKDIHESGGHVISLVNDLLDLSKIEAGKMELEFTSVNLNEIVRSAVSIMQPQSQRGRIVIRSAMTMKLPAVVADERAVKQIVLNLLSNAVKFTDPGGQIIVSTTQSDLGEVTIRVRDTGIGMSSDEIGQAMEPFKQLSATRRAGGTGLGLPLTKALVEANRAAIRISSVKNEGTLVEVVFPPTRVMANS